MRHSNLPRRFWRILKRSWWLVGSCWGFPNDDDDVEDGCDDDDENDDNN